MSSPRTLGLSLALLALTLVVYGPVKQAGFVWDDNQHFFENHAVTAPDGLRAIWTSFVLPVYYPLTFTVFWLIYQLAAFEVTHVVLSPGASQEMIRGLIYQLHKQHPMHDTKIENIPREHEAWQEFQKLGYLEVFSRIEMFKALDSLR